MERKIWMKYWRRAVMVAGILRLVPFVRMVGLNGSMSTGGMNKYSDVDFYIVTQSGRIFTARHLVTIVVHLTGLRRHGYNIAGRICLNRYATEDNLLIGEKNRYHAENFHNLIPLFSVYGCYQRYLQANSWMSEYGFPLVYHEVVVSDTLFSSAWRGFWEWLLAPIVYVVEPLLRKRQLYASIKDPRVKHPKSKVVITDKELRFHLYKGAK